MRVFQLMNNLRPGFLPTTNTAGLLGTKTAVGYVTGFCSSFRSTQGHPPSSDDFESDCPEHFLVRRPDKCCLVKVAKSCIAFVVRRLPEFIVFGVRRLVAPTQLCLASSSTPKSRKWPLNEDDHSSQSTNGQPHRTDPPVSLKPVVGDLDVCVLVKAKPLPPSSSSSSFPHHNQSPSPLRRSIENSTALSSSSRTRDGPGTQVFQHIASLQAGFRPKANYSHLHRVTTTIRDQRQPSAPAPIQHKGLPSSDDFESDCPEHFVSKGKTPLPDDGGAAVHRVGNQAFSLKLSSSEVNLDAGNEQIIESCCSCLAGSTPKPKPVRILNAPTQLCLASSSTPKSRKWPLNEDDHRSQSTNGQPHRTDPPLSLKPVVGDLDVSVLVKAKPLPPSSSSSSFPHHNQSPSPLRRSIENSTALSSSSRTRDGPGTQVFQHIASLQAGFRPKANYSHLHRVTTTIRDQRQPSAPAPIQHNGLPFSDDFESDCPENFVSKGKTLLPDDGGAAVHRVGHHQGFADGRTRGGPGKQQLLDSIRPGFLRKANSLRFLRMTTTVESAKSFGSNFLSTKVCPLSSNGFESDNHEHFLTRKHDAASR
ncbi:hypothetical protein MRX96_011892 [Rhipicephalus microplus]